jgi:hypothetical protein
MEYNEEEVEEIAKSMYKAVKKALEATSNTKEKAGIKQNKGVIEDILDDNFTAEAENNVPPRKEAQMNKGCGLKKQSKYDDVKTKEEKDKEWSPLSVKGVHTATTLRNKGISDTGTMVRNPQKRTHGNMKITAAKEHAKKNIKYNKENKPKLVKSEKGVEKLKIFIKNQRKQ